MNQPPDDDFYGSSTEVTELPPQEDFPQYDPMNGPGAKHPGLPAQSPGSQPGFNPGPQPGPFEQPGPGPQRPPQGFAHPQSQGPQSQPGFAQAGPSRGPQSQPGFAQAGPSRGPQSQPGFEQPGGPSRGPQSQPGFEQPGHGKPMDQRVPGPSNVAPQKVNDQGKLSPQRSSNFPPPSGPISQPGFSSAGQPQRDQYATQASPYPGNNPQSGETVVPWEQQQPNVSARQSQQPGVSPWEQQQPNVSARQMQQPGVSPWEQQPNSLSNWPTVAQSQTPAKPRRSRLMLVVALVGLVLLVIGSGTFVLFSHTSNSTNPTPPPKTAISDRGTPVATHPAGTQTASTRGFNSINTPVQGGADWLVTITGARTTTASIIAPNVGNTYLEIHLTLKNISSKTLTVVSIIEFTLTDASGHRYNETATDTNIHRPPDGNINANQTLDAQLAYEVPAAQHTFVLTFAYGLSSNSKGSIAWKFAA